MRALSMLVVLLLLLAGQGSHASLDYQLSYSSAAPPTHSFPTYPAVQDYASGTCVGYAFCFAEWNPPVVTEPDVMCPAGYDLSTSKGLPICVQKSGVCPSGFDLSSTGQCCTVRSSGNCYANWDTCSGSVLSDVSVDVDIGSICQGTPAYKKIVDNVQMVEVTSGSKWFDGTMDEIPSTDDAYSTLIGSMGAYTAGTSTDTSGDDDVDDTDYQVIPGGNMVNLNGKLVHVGPVPSSTGNGGGNMGGGNMIPPGSVTASPSPAQQAALDALKQQAQQQGTYIADQSGLGGNASGQPGAITTPQMASQQAALDALKQQAAQQGTYIARQDGNSSGSSSGSSARYSLPPLGGQSVMPGGSGSRTGSKKYSVLSSSSSSSGSGSRLAVVPPKEGLLLMKMLLLLPKIMLGAGAGAAGAVGAGAAAAAAPLLAIQKEEVVAKKEVMASTATTKEDLLPKCFSKCCSSDADIVCVASSQSINYAKPAYICPPGCTFIDNTNKCLCSQGHFTPCQPTDTVCSWGDQPICAGSSEFFGIDACKFVGALQQHLPKVQCPYKSLSVGIQAGK